MPHIYTEIEGWFTYADLYDKMVKKYPLGIFLEIGCWFGRSGTYLLEKILEEKSLAQVYFVDTFLGEEGVPYQKDIIEKNGKNFLITTFVNNITKVSTVCNWTVIQKDSIEAASFFEDDFFDFVFIDGFHPQCYEDMVAYYPKVKSGGTMAGHDINGIVVTEAVRKFAKEYNIKIDEIRDEREYWIFEKTLDRNS